MSFISSAADPPGFDVTMRFPSDGPETHPSAIGWRWTGTRAGDRLATTIGIELPQRTGVAVWSIPSRCAPNSVNKRSFIGRRSSPAAGQARCNAPFSSRTRPDPRRKSEATDDDPGVHLRRRPAVHEIMEVGRRSGEQEDDQSRSSSSAPSGMGQPSRFEFFNFRCNPGVI